MLVKIRIGTPAVPPVLLPVLLVYLVAVVGAAQAVVEVVAQQQAVVMEEVVVGAVARGVVMEAGLVPDQEVGLTPVGAERVEEAVEEDRVPVPEVVAPEKILSFHGRSVRMKVQVPATPDVSVL
jgi:hypothetical protein